MTPQQKASALAMLGIAVFPVREKPERVGDILHKIKTPYTRSGHLEASLDASTIARWWARWPDALVGVNAGLSSLVALDIDMGDGHDGWNSIIEAELDDLPETVHYQTRRGGDHYIYAAPSGVHIGPTKGHVTPAGRRLEDIDRRAGSSYFIWWGEDVPSSREDFGSAPEWLLTPSPEPTERPYRGSVAEWLQRIPGGEPGLFMQARLSEIPSADFGHDTLVSLQASIVNLASDGESGGAVALETLRREWLRPPYNTPEYERDWVLALEGAVRKFGAFPEKAADILVQDQASIAGMVKAGNFLDTWISLPPVVTAESLRERVAYIMSLAFSSNLTPLQAATLGWASPAAKHDLGIRGKKPLDEALDAVWALAIHVAANPVIEERNFLVELEPVTPAPEEPELLPGRKVKLLTDAEAAHVIDLDWWGEEFMRVMRSTHAVMSDQYYRLARWMILSLCFADKAVIPSEEGHDIILNFYGVIVGGSKTGKSRSAKPIQEMGKLFWAGIDNPDIGGDATAAALTQALIRRDGRTSLFRSDEADAILLNWADQKGEFRGMKQRITDIYLGDVPAIQRATQSDLSGIHAEAFLNVHLSGIDYKIADAIEPGDWETGFINRFVWAKGERKARTAEQKRFRVRRTGAARAGGDLGKWYQQWVSKFQAISASVLQPSGEQKRVWIDFADDVLDRHVSTDEMFERIAASSPYEERLDPTFGRLSETILKCAALVAISDRRTCVQMDDYLLALEQGEEWASNILELVEATDESPRARKVNRLADFIRSNGGRMPLSAVHRAKGYAGDAWGTAKLVDELIAQGRAEELDLRKSGGERIVALIGEGAA